MLDPITLQREKIAADLAFLMECLREVLVELGEDRVVRLLPWCGDNPPADGQMPGWRGSQLLSIAFQLLGMVEENAAVQVRRRVETAHGPSHERGLWGNTFRRLAAEGFGEEEIAAALGRVHVEPVLTAHPTEVKRATVLARHRALYLLLVRRENPRLTPAEQHQIREEIKEGLELLWRTGNIYMEKPEVRSELRGVLHYLRHVFPECLPILDQRLEEAWRHEGRDFTLLREGRRPLLTFGTWVGGDRDGHPLVTAETTRHALQELRLQAFSVLRQRLIALAAKLSLSDQIQPVPEALAAWIAERGARLGDAGRSALERNPGESWRGAVNLVIASLPLAVVREQVTRLSDSAASYRRPEELATDLAVLDRALREVGGVRLAEMELFRLRRLLDSTGFHLAVLDVRQNSAFHDRAVAQLLTAAGMADADFAGWPEGKRAAFIDQELALPRPFLLPGLPAGAEADAVLQCYRVLANHLSAYGDGGIGSLIVSMTRSCSDLLTVYLLARETGLLVYGDRGCHSLLPVVPLFETIDDLDRAPGIMDRFLAHPVTARTLAASGERPVQQVMIGYSDSCKDGGILASHGALYRAQRELSLVGERHGVEIRFFHGRGGSIGRGAGPTFRFLETLPPGSLTGPFRMTEQGETISQKYANLLTATYNLELQLAGVLGMTVRRNRRGVAAPEMPEIMDLLVDSSKARYAELIASNGLMTFFSQATPIDVMEHLRIGSRPARRTGARTLADLRAIPWVFSWNQARFLLPSWYGAGTALLRLKEAQPALHRLLCSDITRFPLLRYVFMNVELAILQADPEIMRDYSGLVADGGIRRRFMGEIETEYRLTEAMLGELFAEPLEKRRPMQLSAMRLRTAPLGLLHRQQIALLREWRAIRDPEGDGPTADRLLTELFLTVNAIAGGIRNTG